MINEVNNKINQINAKMYVPVKLPYMAIKKMRAYITTNLLSANISMNSRIIFGKKSLVVLGSLGFLSNAIFYLENKRN